MGNETRGSNFAGHPFGILRAVPDMQEARALAKFSRRGSIQRRVVRVALQTPAFLSSRERHRFLFLVRITRRDGVHPMEIRVVNGDLLEQKVEVIVNAWNRNIIPWWLLIPQGVSGAIKRRGGYAPFRELGRKGPIPLGGAVLTGAGTLPFKGIIHAAGIDMLWRASERSIRESVSNSMKIVSQERFASVAFPIIGAGSGGFNASSALAVMRDAFKSIHSNADASIVQFLP